MRRVIIESPFAGNVSANIAYARRAVRDSLLRCEAPLASHLLYTQPGILRDAVLEERKYGIEAGLCWVEFAELVAVYADLGISAGMQQGIDKAKELGVPVEVRKIGVIHE